jgi:hypothetical protein
MSAVILGGSYDALKVTGYVGKLDIIDLANRLLSLTILLYFDGRQLKVPNHLVNKAV